MERVGEPGEAETPLPAPGGATARRQRVTDRIEAHALIDAPVEAIWRALTDPARIARWWSDAAEIDPRPGGEGRLSWTGKATAAPTTVGITVERLAPARAFAFRWLHPRRPGRTRAAPCWSSSPSLPRGGGPASG